MEITKAKNFDTNGVAEFESVDEETHEVTPDMKYIKWPSKKKVFSELVSVAVASIIIAMVIISINTIGPNNFVETCPPFFSRLFFLSFIASFNSLFNTSVNSFVPRLRFCSIKPASFI